MAQTFQRVPTPQKIAERRELKTSTIYIPCAEVIAQGQPAPKAAPSNPRRNRHNRTNHPAPSRRRNPTKTDARSLRNKIRLLNIAPRPVRTGSRRTKNRPPDKSHKLERARDTTNSASRARGTIKPCPPPGGPIPYPIPDINSDNAKNRTNQCQKSCVVTVRYEPPARWWNCWGSQAHPSLRGLPSFPFHSAQCSLVIAPYVR